MGDGCGEVWGRCREVCRGMGRVENCGVRVEKCVGVWVRGDVGKCVGVWGEMWGIVGGGVGKCVLEMWGSVLGCGGRCKEVLGEM